MELYSKITGESTSQKNIAGYSEDRLLINIGKFMKDYCYESESQQKDTAGKPIMIRICYCGTTACKNLANIDYPLSKDFDALAIQKHYKDILSSKLI